MDRITLKNFRCFRDEQTARMAPLTLLVGENSTGKTSFMAMIRALWDIAYGLRVPDFKEEPYDLGSFYEIAHHRGSRGSRATEFEAGFGRPIGRRSSAKRSVSSEVSRHFSVRFARDGTVPIPVLRRLTHRRLWFEECFTDHRTQQFRIGTSRGSWQSASAVRSTPLDVTRGMMRPFGYSLSPYESVEDEDEDTKWLPLNNSPEITKEDLHQLIRLTRTYLWPTTRRPYAQLTRPHASAPVRSKPYRTYDPARSSPDPEGNYVPMYLANLYFQDRKGWQEIKRGIEGFGRSAGLFDEISIKTLGKRESEPFQMQVRKYGGKLKGPRRNVIDVGYGVSQVLPVITELLRQDAPPMFLLQQPEVHLHPSAQAALGSLFCQVASRDRQLIVETHGDHVIDRVRMDVRDGQGHLQPDDVSILFFERVDLDVRIHSLRLDEQGNVLGAPECYRKFFMEETRRSLGI